MEFVADQPASNDEPALPVLEIDTVTALVFWPDGADYPDVTYTNCSPYEASALLRAGARKLEADFALPLEGELLDDD